MIARQEELTPASELHLVKSPDITQHSLDAVTDINPVDQLTSAQEQLAYRIQFSQHRMVSAIRTQAIEASRLGLPEAEALKAQAKREIERYNQKYHPELVDLEGSE